MADPVDSDRSNDEVLVAYLDGELDAAQRVALEGRLAGDATLKARLDALARGEGRFAEAFDVLLAAAPTERLNSMLAGVVRERLAPRWSRRFAMIAAAIAIFAAGAVVGYLTPMFSPTKPLEVAEQPPPGWRQVVAEYLVLTTGDTLQIIPDSPAVLADELSAVGGKLALDLSADKLALPGHVYLKRAQLFAFRGMPLAQIAYLSKDDGPVAFCIIANGQPDAGRAFEQREGSNIIFWAKNGRGYMLIGKAPRETLEGLASELATKIS